MKISVIIPTKNRRHFLERAINSVLSQECSSILEIVVVNDGSTDDTLVYLQRLKLENLIYHTSKESVGGGAARNIAIKMAKGDYIAFLDDDDEWLPGKIAAQEKYLDKYSFVGTRLEFVSGKSDKVKGIKRFLDTLRSGSGHKTSFTQVYLHSTGISPSSVVMKADNLKEIGGFDPTLRANQGRDLFIRYALQYECPFIINDRLVRQYQNHEGRISSNVERRLEAHAIIHRRYEKHLSAATSRFDEARMLLLKARHEKNSKEKKRLEMAVYGKLRFGNLLPLSKLIAIYNFTK